MLNVEKITVGNLQENTYIVYDDYQDALIFDPGAEPDRIMEKISELQVRPQGILITHAHYDHVGAVDALRDHFQIDVFVHEIEADMFENSSVREGASQPKADHYWTDMGEKTVSSFTFKIAHVPGHSPGHIVYIFEDDAFVINGDTVFQGSIGRTDLPGGSYFDLLLGIGRELMTLPDHFTLYPGHGDSTTIKDELATNPFFEVFRRGNLHQF